MCALSNVASLASSRPHDARSRDLRLLAVNKTIAVEFPLFHSPATDGGIGMVLPAAAGRCVPFCRSRSPHFLALPPRADRPFFYESFLLSLAVPPSRAADNTDGRAFGSCLKGIPQKAPLVPGGTSAVGVREQSPSSKKKRNYICHQNTLNGKRLTNYTVDEDARRVF